MNPYLYLRGLRHAEHTVFAVQDGQKFYKDPQFGIDQAYSSGQQVKRCVMEALTGRLNIALAPVTFNWEVKRGKKAEEDKVEMKQPWSACDPSFLDQLVGGYMKAVTGEVTIKRRSPLSISAMRPLHPLLGGLEGRKEDITFDRSSYSENNPVLIHEDKKDDLSPEQIDELQDRLRRKFPPRFWNSGHTRASGLFVYDVAVDLRTLFCVSTNTLEPELHPTKVAELKAQGWTESRNVFGPCLLAPKKMRDDSIPALAHALLNWRITSNQARTFSLMETLAVAISDNANHLAGAIRARLDEEKERKAHPLLDETAGAKLYVMLPASGYIRGVQGAANALDQAEQDIAQRLREFDYEKQTVPVASIVL